MKKILMVVLAMVLLSGCGLANSRYFTYNFRQGTIMTATVGSPMIDTEETCKNDVYGNVLASFNMQLIYAGKTGSTIRVTYREFSNNLARPAFSQELTYDLSESKTIVYKHIVIEVKEATNSSITFVVEESLMYKYQPGQKVGGC